MSSSPVRSSETNACPPKRAARTWTVSRERRGAVGPLAIMDRTGVKLDAFGDATTRLKDL